MAHVILSYDIGTTGAKTCLFELDKSLRLPCFRSERVSADLHGGWRIGTEPRMTGGRPCARAPGPCWTEPGMEKIRFCSISFLLPDAGPGPGGQRGPRHSKCHGVYGWPGHGTVQEKYGGRVSKNRVHECLQAAELFIYHRRGGRNGQGSFMEIPLGQGK